LTKLQESAPPEGAEISDDFHRSLLDSSKFWVSLLTATGEVAHIKQKHLYSVRVIKAIKDLAEKLRSQRISLEMLEYVLDHTDKDLAEYLAIVNDRQSPPIDPSTFRGL